MNEKMNSWKPGDLLIRKRGIGDPPYEILTQRDKELHLVVSYDPGTDVLDVLTARGTRVKNVSGKAWALTYTVLQ